MVMPSWLLTFHQLLFSVASAVNDSCTTTTSPLTSGTCTIVRNERSTLKSWRASSVDNDSKRFGRWKHTWLRSTSLFNQRNRTSALSCWWNMKLVFEITVRKHFHSFIDNFEKFVVIKFWFQTSMFVRNATFSMKAASNLVRSRMEMDRGRWTGVGDEGSRVNHWCDIRRDVVAIKIVDDDKIFLNLFLDKLRTLTLRRIKKFLIIVE